MQSKMKGVTLVEIILVLAIIGILIVATIGYIQQRAMQMRLDRTSIQMQQILNAALSYYVSNGKWPIPKDNQLPIEATASELKTYLPLKMRSPWNSPYMVSTDGKLFYVDTSISDEVAGSSVAAFSEAIAGTLPLSYTSATPGIPPPQGQPCGTNSKLCYIVAGVNIPGQNLNNATAVNFAGLYHNGACVPVPTCPIDAAGKTMTPQVFLTPVQVSGAYGDTSRHPNPPAEVYPISGFTVFTRGGPGELKPEACDKERRPGGQNCESTRGEAPNGFWRACIQVITERGELNQETSSAWSRLQVVMAVTRCAITNEPSGTIFDVHEDA